jgi:hypothetical protein
VAADRAAGPELGIDRIDAGRPQPHPDVMLTVDLRLRQIRQLQDLRAADGRHQDRAHAPPFMVAEQDDRVLVPLILRLSHSFAS